MSNDGLSRYSMIHHCLNTLVAAPSATATGAHRGLSELLPSLPSPLALDAPQETPPQSGEQTLSLIATAQMLLSQLEANESSSPIPWEIAGRVRHTLEQLSLETGEGIRREKANQVRGLYVIIDPQVTGGREPLDIAVAAVNGGARMLQLRDKLRDKGDSLPLAAWRLQDLCRRNGALLIINDHADVAAAVGSGGLHVGQTDLPVAQARQISGPGPGAGTFQQGVRATCGVQGNGRRPRGISAQSTRPPARAWPAIRKAPSGCVKLRIIAGDTPLVAIGGINLGNVAPVVEAGADAICVTAAVGSAEQPEVGRRRDDGGDQGRRGPSLMPTRYSADLSEIGNRAIEQLTSRNSDREVGLSVSREVIRSSANAIRAVHRSDFDEARRLISTAETRLQDAEHIRASNPSIYNAGFLNDARKEFTEANVTLAVISGNEIPSAEQLGIDPSAYLNGMAEVIGELRRFILDSLRRDNVDRCEELMEVMDEIYGVLVTVDFPRGRYRRPAPHHRRHARRAGAHPRRPDHRPAPARFGVAAGSLAGAARRRLTPNVIRKPVSREATMLTTSRATAETLDRFYEDLRGFSTSPLWLVQEEALVAEPKSKALPFLWRWRDLQPQALRAGDLIGTADAERRVLMLLNPGLNRMATTNSMFAGLQIVMPGEAARAHRHTPGGPALHDRQPRRLHHG